MEDRYKPDNSMTWVVVFFLIGLLWMFLHPANDSAGTPTEHKCWYETGYETC
jgi:hypothetical protein